MTIPAFCRYFKKATGKTFTKLVNEYRVVHATKLLSESQKVLAISLLNAVLTIFRILISRSMNLPGKALQNIEMK